MRVLAIFAILALAFSAVSALRCYVSNGNGGETDVDCGDIGDTCIKVVSGSQVSYSCYTSCPTSSGGTEVYCCNENLCNGASSVTVATGAALLAAAGFLLF